jgi:2-polyprenyl-3-methyl-5-hydroxy-6-metoxy-1,4-benzoquinol methylase
MNNTISSDTAYENFADGQFLRTHFKLLPHVLGYADSCNAESILDIGCGDGAMANALIKPGRTVVGIEPSEMGVALAKKNYPHLRVERMGIYDDPSTLQGGSFDMVISTEVIEHVFYPRELLRFARAKLNSGGLLLVSTPYNGWLKNVAISVLDAWDKHHTALWDGGHIKFWSRRTLSKLFDEEHFDCVGFHGCGRLPFLWESMILVGRKRGR